MSDDETTREYDPARKRCIGSQTSGGSNYDTDHVPAPVEIASQLEATKTPSGKAVFAPDLEDCGNAWIAGYGVDLEVFC
jgi:hypothetical protein